ncbi:UNVERIFIED_CONTAM: hypothetical protein Sradi_1906800 [Sesamum radiatum]|uniref:Uncharacterized protein n=1 Tax=Sesamum radiatum TaxID=300843 RepID=A0AAW2TYT1_SESRA
MKLDPRRGEQAPLISSPRNIPRWAKEKADAEACAQSAWAVPSQNRVRASQLKSPKLLGLLNRFDSVPDRIGL